MSQNVSPPTPLYKYFPARRASKFFENPVLRFTPPLDLNDIFELNPPILELMSDEKLSCLRHFYDACQKNQTVKSFVEIIEQFLKIYDSGGLNSSRNYIMSTLMEKIGMGILSLSSEPDSLLMWAHYCEKDKGFAVELDTSKCFQSEPSEQPFFFPPKKIEYVIDRPIISLLEIGKSDVNGELLAKIENGETELMRLFFKPVFFTKSMNWSYEEEWRVAALPVDSLNTITNDKNLPIIGLTQLPVDAIKSVILGARTEPELQEQALNFSKKHNLTLKQAIPDTRKFSLNIETI